MLLISDSAPWSELVTSSGCKPALPQHKISPDNTAFIEQTVCAGGVERGVLVRFCEFFAELLTLNSGTIYGLRDNNTKLDRWGPLFLFC